MLVEMLADDPQVAGVGPEHDVGRVSHERDEAQHRVEADIGHHPRHMEFGQAQIARFPDDIAAQRRRRDVADNGDQPQHDVQPDRTVDAGQNDHAFEQLFHRLDPLTAGGDALVER